MKRPLLALATIALATAPAMASAAENTRAMGTLGVRASAIAASEPATRASTNHFRGGSGGAFFIVIPALIAIAVGAFLIIDEDDDAPVSA